jgi:molecular chaperone HtpG
VFITDDADLLPSYLRFIRGVVDSEDLPLNISREMLQNNPQLTQIRKAVTGRVITELESLSEKEPENFTGIWDAFGPVIKEGLYEDYERREKLLALSRFTTTTGENRSLKQYIADLKPNQTEVYFLAGDSIERLKSNPKLEQATARGIEVLLLTDPVDAFWTSAPFDFEGKPLKSLSQGDIDFGLIPRIDDSTQETEADTDEASIIAAIKATLGDRVLSGCRQPWPGSGAGAIAGTAKSRRRHQADPRNQHAPSPGRGDFRRQRLRGGFIVSAAGAGANPRR